MFRSVLIAVLAALTSGCVGVGIYTDTQFRSARGHDDVVVDKKQNVVATTKEQILLAWGEPKTKKFDGVYDVWTYAGHGELAWRGVLVWVLVPIPLMIPAGNNDVQVAFDKHGKVNAIYYGEVKANFYGCNIGFVCGSFEDVTHPSL